MDESTNDILSELQRDLATEASACRGAGDRVTATCMERLAAVLQRNMERRAQREQADTE